MPGSFGQRVGPPFLEEKELDALINDQPAGPTEEMAALEPGLRGGAYKPSIESRREEGYLFSTRGFANPISNLMASYMPKPQARENWLREYMAGQTVASQNMRLYTAQPVGEFVSTSYHDMVKKDQETNPRRGSAAWALFNYTQ